MNSKKQISTVPDGLHEAYADLYRNLDQKPRRSWFKIFVISSLLASLVFSYLAFGASTSLTRSLEALSKSEVAVRISLSSTLAEQALADLFLVELNQTRAELEAQLNEIQSEKDRLTKLQAESLSERGE